MGFTRRTLVADCEISTGMLSVSQLPPIFVGEAGALDVNVTLKLNGQAYTPTGVTASMHLYWPGTTLQTEYVQMSVSGNVISGRFTNLLTALPGSPLLIIRIKEASTNDIIVATATPVRIWQTRGESMVSPTPGPQSSVKSVDGQEPDEFGNVPLYDSHIPSSVITGQDTVALALAYLNTHKANASSVYTKSEVDTALSAKANQATTYTKTEVDTALDLKANQVTTYTKSEVDALVSALFRYKGNKATYDEIQAISTKAIGDVWFCEADSSEYAWDGSKWEKLGPVIDMSAYLTQFSIAGLTIDSSHSTITAAQLRTALDIYTKSEVDTAVSAINDYFDNQNRSLKLESVPESLKKEIDILDSYYDRSENLFDVSAITTGYFINGENGAVTAAQGYCYSDYIKVDPSSTYTVRFSLFGGGCYDQNMNFVKWNRDNKTITTPVNAVYMRLSMVIGNSIGQWCVKGTETGDSDFFDTLKPSHLPEIPSGKITVDFEILLPDTIYLIKDSDFSLYYDSIVFPLELFDKKRYTVIQKASDDTVKGETYSYKWHYTPTTVGETFTMIFSVRDLYTNKNIASKSVSFVVSSAKSGSSKNVILMGDSFMDGYGISGYLYGNIINSGNSLNVLGVNSANSAQYPNLKDNAWAGQGYRWVSGGYSWSKQGALRSDRPLSDAYWDSGWGKDEPNGWTEGETYADLTPTQRSHGHTKNEFFNPTTETFDLSYYLTTYQNGATCDILLSEYGLNDVGWYMGESPNPQWTIDNFVIPAMQKIVDSAIVSNPNINVVFCLIPLNNDDNNSIGRYYANGNNLRTNSNIQIFNKAILDAFGNNSNVVIIPSNANFDNRYGYISGEYEPIKFDSTIKEVHSTDIHPSAIGAKYYADSMTNVIYFLL